MRNQAHNQTESEVNTQYMEETKAKVETLRQALWKFDKDLDDQIDKKELLSFLDSNMKNNQIFDRNLADKIFQTLDFDHSGQISCEEFIKNYIAIEEDIKAHGRDMQMKIIQEKENNANLERLKMENKGEKLNGDGIGQNAMLTIEITNIEFIKKMTGMSENISIRVKFAENERETKVLSQDKNKVTWNEKFE